MKVLKILRIIFALSPIFIFPQHELSDSTPARLIQPVPTTFLPIIIYPTLSMRSGFESVLTLHKGLSFAEDKLIGSISGSETNLFGNWSGIVGRFAKYILIDYPTENFASIFTHEYFGHGSRFREFGSSDLIFSLNLPFPYGSGKGSAGTRNNLELGIQERLAVYEGGMESQFLICRNISLQWMAKHEISYRDANFYLQSLLNIYYYIQSTNDNLTNSSNGYDPENYIKTINSGAGYNNLAQLKMTSRDMKAKTKIILANPYLIYSFYTLCKTFLWDGDKSNKLPTFHFGELNYLPCLRAGLTPFGIEYHLENYLRLNEKVSLVDFGYGDQTFYDSWGSVGILVNNIYMKDDFMFDVHCKIWNQPGIIFGTNNTELKGNGIGGAFSVRGYYDISNPWLPISVVLELGYKTVGFLEGYNLDSSPIIMVGLALRN